MPIYAKGATIVGNAKGGVRVEGDDFIDVEGAVISGNGGDAISVISKSPETPPKEKQWHLTWWGVLSLTVIGGLVVTYAAYRLGWLG